MKDYRTEGPLDGLLLEALARALRSLPPETRSLQTAAERIVETVNRLVDLESAGAPAAGQLTAIEGGGSSAGGDPPGRGRNAARLSIVERTRERHANAYRPWGAEDEAALERLILEELSIEEIASRLGRQPGAVYRRLVKLGLIDPEIAS